MNDYSIALFLHVVGALLTIGIATVLGLASALPILGRERPQEELAA